MNCRLNTGGNKTAVRFLEITDCELKQNQEDGMKILLIAMNAKYIHSNLAVYCLKSYAARRGIETEIAEYTINHRQDDILMDIYQKKPDVVAFSCYIWNLEFVENIARDLHQVLPDLEIWGGGPEVSYDAEKFLMKHPEFRGIMQGEGERTFCELAGLYQDFGKDAVQKLDSCSGIVWRNQKREIVRGMPQAPISLDEVPFIYEEYEDLVPFENRILYYETSRGCPFSCSYCLSSIDRRVRLRSIELVEKELQFFLDHKVPQVKFVDRTFNCNHRHSMAIWNYIKEHDNGITNFHFEIAADILKDEEIQLLSTFRPGLAQLEIGVQSTNMQTIHEIDRVMDFALVSRKVLQVASAGNIHQHLDLIAGLPYENLESFQKSFNDVYLLRPQQFQLGFLKVLKGSKMYEKAEEYGIVYHTRPMYEVLSTKWLSYAEVIYLKGIEEMVEVYYNSSQFRCTMLALEQEFDTPFAMYEALAAYYEKNALNGLNHSRMRRFDILHDFILSCVKEENVPEYEDDLLMDLYLREKSKSRPSWAADLSGYKSGLQEFFKKEAEEKRYLKDYEGYSWKQILNMTHVEIDSKGEWTLFDYKRRDPLTKDAATYIISEVQTEKNREMEKKA